MNRKGNKNNSDDFSGYGLQVIEDMPDSQRNLGNGLIHPKNTKTIQKSQYNLNYLS